MSKTSYRIDKEGFETAAAAYPEVYANRDAHIAVRRYLVENNFLNPGDTADAQVYAMALGMMKANGALPQRVKTAEETAAEAQAAAELEARRNAGVIRYEDKPARKMTDEYVNRDPVAERNAAADAALQAKQNPMLTRREQMDSLLARMDPANIPGLVDESFAGCSVYTNGRVNHYKTQQAQEVAKQTNAEVRARYAEQQAAAQVAASQKKGI
ncbi:MAG: hypothetical protein WAN14_20400 [Candidatus Acidiferrales bacterium]